MIELKCPFCQQELDTGNYYVHCHNPHCNITVDMEGTEEMWDALIRAHKTLEIAVDALKEIIDWDKCVALQPNDFVGIANKALEKITTQEQKDK